MKNSTLYNSNLTKDRVSFLEDLKNNDRNSMLSNNRMSDMKEYTRQASPMHNQKELDVLWRNFKVAQTQSISEKSPGVYLGVGFFAGFLSMLVLSLCMSFVTPSNTNAISKNISNAPKLIKRVKLKPSQLTIVPPDKKVVKSEPALNETYTVVSGDTLESIVVRFYGKYDPAKVQAIQEANNMTDPNKLQLGQQLNIPL